MVTKAKNKKSPTLFDFESVYDDRKVRRVWEVDEVDFAVMRDTKDGEGRRLYLPDSRYPESNGTFMGIEINIVEEPGIRIALYYHDTLLLGAEDMPEAFIKKEEPVEEEPNIEQSPEDVAEDAKDTDPDDEEF